MLINLLDWLGSVAVILGSVIVASKKASKSRIRMFALSFYLLSNCVFIPFAIILETYWFLTAQVILFIINLRGIILCFKEIKKGVK